MSGRKHQCFYIFCSSSCFRKGLNRYDTGRLILDPYILLRQRNQTANFATVIHSAGLTLWKWADYLHLFNLKVIKLKVECWNYPVFQ